MSAVSSTPEEDNVAEPHESLATFPNDEVTESSKSPDISPAEGDDDAVSASNESPDVLPFKIEQENEKPFYTGIDLFSEEEKKKRELRAIKFGTSTKTSAMSVMEQRQARFGVVVATVKNRQMLQVRDDEKESLKDLLEEAASLDDPKTFFRHDTIHLYGTKMLVDEWLTSNVVKLFEDFGVKHVEWLTDSRCNVVFGDRFSTERAMRSLSRALPQETPATEENELQNQFLDTDVALLRWRMANVCKPKSTLFFRLATRHDVKRSFAHRKGTQKQRFLKYLNMMRRKKGNRWAQQWMAQRGKGQGQGQKEQEQGQGQDEDQEQEQSPSKGQKRVRDNQDIKENTQRSQDGLRSTTLTPARNKRLFSLDLLGQSRPRKTVKLSVDANDAEQPTTKSEEIVAAEEPQGEDAEGEDEIAWEEEEIAHEDTDPSPQQKTQEGGFMKKGRGFAQKGTGFAAYVSRMRADAIKDDFQDDSQGDSEDDSDRKSVSPPPVNRGSQRVRKGRGFVSPASLKVQKAIPVTITLSGKNRKPRRRRQTDKRSILKRSSDALITDRWRGGRAR